MGASVGGAVFLVGLWFVLTPPAAAAGWSIVTTPAKLEVPGTVNILVDGPGPAPTALVKEPEVALYRHRMTRESANHWELSVQLLEPGTTTIRIESAGQVVATKSVQAKAAGGAILGRIIGGVILLGGFLWMWSRTRRLYRNT